MATLRFMKEMKLTTTDCHKISKSMHVITKARSGPYQTGATRALELQESETFHRCNFL